MKFPTVYKPNKGSYVEYLASSRMQIEDLNKYIEMICSFLIEYCGFTLLSN